jgi:hypothetical protein
MKRISLVLLASILSLVWLVVGCTSITDGGWKMDNIFPTPKNSICTTIPEGESLICQKLRNPEAINSALYIANAVLLDSMTLKEVEKEKAVVMEVIWWLKQPDVINAAFQKFVVEKAGSLIAIAAAEEIGMFQFNQSPMFEADKLMLIASLEKTNRLIDIAITMKK